MVTRASPATETDALPFTAYAVLNDALTSDGSFIPPLVAGILPAGDGDLLVPVVLDAHGLGGSHFTTEPRSPTRRP